jgi:hypothetical protein
MTEPRNLRAHLPGQPPAAHSPGPAAPGNDIWDQWQGIDPANDILALPMPAQAHPPHRPGAPARPPALPAGSLAAPVLAAARPTAARPTGAPGLTTGFVPAPQSQAAAGGITSSVSNAGAVAMNVPNATSTYGATGTGVKIGILSNSFNAQNAAAAEEADGDLPSTVTVVQDYASGDDEGRAMAELVHAAAPGAQIYFATAETTLQNFASNILALAAAGCKVIVDDVTYFDEPFFQTGDVVQQAIETVIAEGVSYFTSASNEGTNFYQAGISLVSARLPGHLATSELENFGATAAANSGSDTLQQVTIGGGDSVTFDLQWTQPFQSIGGTGTAYSLAIYLYQNGTLVGSATVNDTGGDPVQTLTYQNTGGSGTFDIAIALNGGTVASTAGGTLKYIIYAGNTTYDSINDSAAGSGSGTVTGHELLADVNTVGAIAAGSTSGPESFSSVGPGAIYYNASGTALTTPQATGKVDFLAPDGISTSVSGFSQFYGTSAAAPDAAAVATLLLQVNPNLSPAEISADLAGTATAISGNANQVGAGLVNADAALGAAYGSTWTVAAGGLWGNAAGWAAGALPAATAPVTLDDDLGTLTANYTLTVNIANAVAETLTLGNDSTAIVTLAIAAGESLSVGGGATVAANGRLTDGGTLAVAADLGGTGSITLAAGSLLTLSSTSALVGGFTAPISVQGKATIDLSGLTYNRSYSESYASGTLTISNAGTTEATLQFATTSNNYSFTLGNDANNGETLSVACYREGTRIATPLGDVPIEQLAIGDTILTAAGHARTLRWIGRRAYSAAAVAANRAAQPIRIAAAALDGRLPYRDLWVSPEHALLLPGVDGTPRLVPAQCLVNGHSITRESAAAPIVYLHLELAGHDAVRAEGQPAETFIDDASRTLFDNADTYQALYPAEPAVPAAFCAPRIGAGAELARLRAAIAGRAGLSCGPLRGSVDSATGSTVIGWAQEPDHPGAPVLLEILAGEDSIGFALADRFRVDLAQAGIGDGYHGFVFTLPEPLAADRRHILNIRRAADAATLPDGLVLIDRVALEPLLEALAGENPAALAARLATEIDRLHAALAA